MSKNSIDNQELIQFMRRSNWNEAKAKLYNILDSFYSKNDEERAEFDELFHKMSAFVRYMEDESPIA